MSEELLQDQYVRHLEQQTKDQQERIESLERSLENLEHRIQVRGGFAGIDDARMKAQLYDLEQKERT